MRVCVSALLLVCLQDLEYDNLNNPVNFINKYIVLPKNFSSEDTLSFILDKDELDEGEGQGSGFRSMHAQFGLNGRRHAAYLCCSLSSRPAKHGTPGPN